MQTVDQRANEIGRRQWGRVTRRQLRDDAGISGPATAARVGSGVWREPLPNVIDLGTHRASWRAHLMEVLLAAGPTAWVSHDSAAHLHRMLDAPRPSSIDVLVPRGRHAAIGDLRLHTCRSLGGDEVTEVRGLGCTTPARTLLDLAVGTAPQVLERYLLDGVRRDPRLLETVVELTDRHRTLPGRRRLLRVVALVPATSRGLGSPIEVLAAQRLREAGAPRWVAQLVVRDPVGARIKRVDFAWPDRRAILEVDGAGYHDLTGVRVRDEADRQLLRIHDWDVTVLRRRDLDGPALRSFVRTVR